MAQGQVLRVVSSVHSVKLLHVSSSKVAVSVFCGPRLLHRLVQLPLSCWCLLLVFLCTGHSWNEVEGGWHSGL
jgi:hypothetical protein